MSEHSSGSYAPEQRGANMRPTENGTFTPQPLGQRLTSALRCQHWPDNQESVCLEAGDAGMESL
jgi:hypothetical protein